MAKHCLPSGLYYHRLPGCVLIGGGKIYVDDFDVLEKAFEECRTAEAAAEEKERPVKEAPAE